jgi:hypothetical protein
MKTSSFAIPSVNIQLGKRKQRSQMCLIFTDDGKIIERELAVLRGCCDDPEHNAAYLIDHENQYVGQDGNSYQIVSERSCIPICMRQKSNITDLKKLMNDISKAASAAARRQPFADSLKDKWGDKLLWVITIPFSAMVAIFIISRI